MSMFNKFYGLDYQMSFSTPFSPALEGIINLHHDIFSYALMIIVLISYLLVRTIMLFRWNNSKIQMYISHKEQVLLEVLWTLFPIVILIFVAISSLSLLYSIEEGFTCKMSAHIVGHQWYWTYYYPLFNLQFDSCMIPESDLKLGELRLLEVDNRFCLPFVTHLRLLLTSADVIHSWAVPSFGIKLDACPGRLTQCHLFCKQIGIYTGQCSEICGVGHAFMPISVQMIDNKSFFKFISVVTPIHEERPCFDLFPIKK